MKTNNLFYTPIFRLRSRVFIRISYSCPSRIILFLQVSNKTSVCVRVLQKAVNSPTRARQLNGMD